MSGFERSVRREVGFGRMYYDGQYHTLPPSIFLEHGQLISFDHPSWPSGRRGGDVGGPFWQNQTWIKVDQATVVARGLGRVYEGTIRTSTRGSGGVPFDMPCPPRHESIDSVVRDGTTAISRTIPTNPSLSVATSLAELRNDGLPKLCSKDFVEQILKTNKTQLSRTTRAAGGEYLNVQFGWKPLVRDLRAFMRSAKKSNDQLRQLYRDSGPQNSVRRSYHFPTETSKTEPIGPMWGNVAPFMCDGGQLDSWMLSSGPSVGPPSPTGYTIWSESETKTWFKGAYSYVMPSPPRNLMDHLDTWDAEFNKLYGTRITPEVIWNATPWTWMADWFANTGDIVHNVSAFQNDSLALKYGYIMRQTTQSDHGAWQGYVNNLNNVPVFVKIQESTGSTQKLRLQASPFGFGVLEGSLDPSQTAIVAALGASRSPRYSL